MLDLRRDLISQTWKIKNGEKSKTTARLTQRNIFKTIFRLAKPAFFFLYPPIHCLIPTNLQAQGQTDKPTNWLTDWPTGWLTDRQTDTHTDRQTDRQTADRRLDGQRDEWMEIQINGLTDQLIDRIDWLIDRLIDWSVDQVYYAFCLVHLFRKTCIIYSPID